MGHIGLTPQSQNQLGGYHVQGRTAEQAKVLLDDALALEAAGAFSIVLEYVAAPVARLISERLDVPTIGIGAGPDCDGQVLVFHDMLGLGGDPQLKHAKRYADIGRAIGEAAQAYVEEVRGGAFPDEAHSFSMRPGEEALLGEL
jgi:3-methyl-2-oxobutanoate hydroxymethyltransferase